MNVADILAKRRPLERRVRLLLDGSVNAELEDLRREIRQQKTREVLNPQGLATTVPELERRLNELTLKADEAAAIFTFRAIARVQLEELKRTYPPTEDQWERYREQVKANIFSQAPEFDWTELAPALISACCVDPAMNAQDAANLWDQLSDGEAAELFAAAWSVNAQTTSRPFYGTGTVTTPTSGPDSTTAQNGESPSPFSVDGS